ncbi:MAG: hypothetical protein ACI4TK_19140 [Agathobacter sp.]
MNDNQLKSLNGRLNKDSLGLLLGELLKQNLISSCTAEYRNGYSGYDGNQFYAPYYIEFENREAWLLYSVSSIRSDRVNNQQWNAYHLKQLAKNITKAFLVVPTDIINSDKEWKAASSYDRKLKSNMFTSIDAVVRQDILVKWITNHSRKEKRDSFEDTAKYMAAESDCDY